jgi:tetratricopeptide (TPR) repeat protein
MNLREMRRSLKPWLRRHPILFRSYNAISWTLTRSQAGVTVKRSLSRIAIVLFPTWIRPRCRLADYYARQGNLEKANAIADDLINHKIDFYNFRTYRIGGLYYLQGRYEDAYRVFERMEQRRYKRARELQYDRLRLRAFPSLIFSAIGHLGLLDKYIKAEILGLIPR